MSGDETKHRPNLEEAISNLFDDCAPITIHAGEAARAESIWNAVHKLGAQRIGHGLRLREDRRLLMFCVRRGICMELCPISNAFTNSFVPPPPPPRDGRRSDSSPTSGQRQMYPLRYFIEKGMDVSINTDNRYLHSRHTLTDDYLEAARLSGGLTRWEVLKIAKSGFKHAFLEKEQVAALLRHVEFEVYQLVASADSGYQHFPPPRPVEIAQEA